MLDGHHCVRPDLVVGLVGLVLSGFASIWYITTANTLVQLRAAAQLRGRVMGVWVMALPGANPLTSVLAAVLAGLAGIRFTLFRRRCDVASGRALGRACAVADYRPSCPGLRSQLNWALAEPSSGAVPAPPSGYPWPANLGETRDPRCPIRHG